MKSAAIRPSQKLIGASASSSHRSIEGILQWHQKARTDRQTGVRSYMVYVHSTRESRQGRRKKSGGKIHVDPSMDRLWALDVERIAGRQIACLLSSDTLPYGRPGLVGPEVPANERVYRRTVDIIYVSLVPSSSVGNDGR